MRTAPGRPWVLLALALVCSSSFVAAQAGPRVQTHEAGPFETTLRFDGTQAPASWTQEFALPAWADWAEVALERSLSVHAGGAEGVLTERLVVDLDGIEVAARTETTRVVFPPGGTPRTTVQGDTLRSPQAADGRFDVTSLDERVLRFTWTGSVDVSVADNSTRVDAELQELVVTYGETAAEEDLTPWLWVVGAVVLVLGLPVVTVVLGRKVAATDGDD